MKYRGSIPADPLSLGILGYAVIVNKQIHSYQIAILSDYLGRFNLTIENTVLAPILDGAETSTSLAAAMDAFSREGKDVQATLISLAIQLSNIDSRVDGAEETLLTRIAKESSLSVEDIADLRTEACSKAINIRAENNLLFEPPFHRQASKSIWRKIGQFFQDLFRRLFKRNRISKEQQMNQAYVAAISRCAEVAKDDFEIVCPAYDQIIAAGESASISLKTIMSNFSLEIGLSAEVGKLVAVFADHLQRIAAKQMRAAKESLFQKERTLSDFTISLIGRTKAGKSTLHSILTNEGREKIGVGLQRTTRYNRVYQWNLLRLIDTPGIGSAEAEGRTDDQIAESVLGESDIICCVIVDDSIQQDILEFIEKIAALNKPVIILLNHKENIRPVPKFNKYLKNPRLWIETSGETNLQGHINRIQRYAQAKGFDHQITVFPVFLLAALMAGEEEYRKHQEVLWNSSNIEEFVQQLKQWIIEAGPIKRSQTLLDETIRNFERAASEIEAEKSLVAERCKELKARKQKTMASLKSEQAKMLDSIERLLTDRFSSLANQEAYAFAETHYSQTDDLSKLWAEYLSDIGFSDRLRDDISIHLDAFSSKAKEAVSEVFEDFYYSLHFSADIGVLNHTVQIDLKSITKILGGLLDLVGGVLLMISLSNPIGWALAIFGIGFHFLSKLFKSKAKKRQEAIERVYTAVKQGIQESAPNNIKSSLQDIQTSTNETLEKIERIFDELIEGLEKTVFVGVKLVQAYGHECRRLNKVYAWRILKHLEQEFEVFSQEKVESTIAKVSRTNGKEIHIYARNAKQYDTSRLTGVLAEKVTIHLTEERT